MPNKSIKTKVICESITEYNGGVSRDILLRVSKYSPENRNDIWKYNPSGDIVIHTTTDANMQFVLGREYYIEISNVYEES